MRACWIVTVGALAFCILSACTSDPEPSAASDAGGIDGGRTSEAGSTLGDKCAAEQTVESCASCCGHTDTVLDPYTQAYDKCACAGPCKTRCATTSCAPTPTADASPDCAACLEAEDTVLECDVPGNDACDKDAKCKAFLACDAIATCLDKTPEKTDGG